MEDLEAFLVSFSLVFARVATAVRLLPVLGGAPLPFVAGLCLSAAISLGLTALPAAPTAVGDVPVLAALLVQIAAGAVIGTVGRLLFVLLEIPGGLATPVAWPDVSREGYRPDLSRGLVLFGFAALVAAGGHRALIAAFAISFEMTGPPVTLVAGGGLLRLFSDMLAAGVLLSLPVLGCGLVMDAAKGLFERITEGSFELSLSALRQLAVQLVLAFSFLGCVSRFVEASVHLAPWLRGHP